MCGSALRFRLDLKNKFGLRPKAESLAQNKTPVNGRPKAFRTSTGIADFYLKSMKSTRVAIGFRAKTGRAICVVLGRASDAPIVAKKFEMCLTDPKVPHTFQPYHAVMELPWEQSQKAARKSVAAIETVARRGVKNLIEELKSQDMKVCGVGIVGAPDRDLTRIGNFHIRAHAAEGVLFRNVLNLAAASNGLKWRLIPDKAFEQLTRSELGARASTIKRQISELGRTVPAPWRADEKQAALAAWLMLPSG